MGPLPTSETDVNCAGSVARAKRERQCRVCSHLQQELSVEALQPHGPEKNCSFAATDGSRAPLLIKFRFVLLYRADVRKRAR